MVHEKRSCLTLPAVALGICLGAAGSLCAAGVEWPSDFWQQVTNRIESVASAPVDSEPQDGFASFGRCPLDVALTLGTADLPFDSRLFSEQESAVFPMNSFPRGLSFIVR